MDCNQAPSTDPDDCPATAPDTRAARAPVTPVAVHFHPSQFPGAVEAAFCESLRNRRMNHKFHYDTPRQAHRWLQVHEAFSPARQDHSCQAAYEAGARAAAALCGDATVEVVSLGCGGGQKELNLLRALRTARPARPLRYVPADVSPGLALVARAAALEAGLVSPAECAPLVLDLALAEDWREALAPVLRPDVRRLITFFGMMPNFTPGQVLPRLASLLGPSDGLLVSANLAPGANYAAGVRQVLPLYHNALTSEWLFTVLAGLGVTWDDGRIEFRVAACPEGSGLLRFEADFVFARSCTVPYAQREWRYDEGERFGLFYSYRHTPERVAALFADHGLTLRAQWLNTGGDEGVFLIGRDSDIPH